MQVLATDRNPGIEYEYWLPPDQYALYHGRRSPLRQAHHTASYLPWSQPTASATTTTTRVPQNTPRPHWCKAHILSLILMKQIHTLNHSFSKSVNCKSVNLSNNLMLLKAQFRLRRNFRLPLKTHKYRIKEISASHFCKGRNS